MNSKAKDTLFYFSGYYAFFVLGLYVLMIGTILPYILRETGLSLTLGGVMLALKALGNVFGGALLTILSNKTGHKFQLVLSPFLIALGYFLVILSEPLLMYPGFFLSGIGWGGINNLVNLTVSEKSGGNQVILARTHMFFALGALTSPILTAFVISRGYSWQTPATIVIFMALLSSVMYIPVKFPHRSGKKDSGDISLSQAIKHIGKNRIFLVFMGMLFFYVGFESTINGWVVTYFMDTGKLTDNAAQWALSLFWITCTLGRLGVPLMFKSRPKSHILIFFSITSILSFIFMLLSPSSFYILVFMAAMGFSLACFYPVTISAASNHISNSKTLAALLMGFGALGGSLVPMATGRISDFSGIYSGMVTAGLSIAILLILSLVYGKSVQS